MNDAQWILAPAGEEAKRLAAALELPLPIARILVNRKLADPEAARRFLSGTMADLHDPYAFADMRAAVERIERAVAARDKILIFGDYDVDGVLSVVMLHRALTSLGADVDYFIPERLRDGYGIKDEHLGVVRERGAKLVISVDCGIRAVGFTALARQAGIDVIVTDHHLPGGEIPVASAVLDPVVSGSGYPEKNLAGVGVVFKLIQALFEKNGLGRQLRHYLKLVAIGTISDVSELRGENRIFVRIGLEELRGPSNAGLRSLLDVCGLTGRKITEGDVGFRIGPRINAAGRLGRTELALRLFFADAPAETEAIAKTLDGLNSERQRTEELIFKQAGEKVRSRALDARYKILILGSEAWHRGIVGIVASRLKDEFRRPVILFSYEDGKAFGSGRSIHEFSLIDCLEACREHCLTYGGHTYAVGCSLRREELPAFRQAANAVAEARISEEDLRKKIRLDADLALSEIDGAFWSALERLSPFGVGNPKPLFLFPGVEIVGDPQVLKGKHLKLRLRQGGRTVEALGWGKGAWAGGLARGGRIDAAGGLASSTYMGEDRMQIILEDIRP